MSFSSAIEESYSRTSSSVEKKKYIGTSSSIQERYMYFIFNWRKFSMQMISMAHAYKGTSSLVEEIYLGTSPSIGINLQPLKLQKLTTYSYNIWIIHTLVCCHSLKNGEVDLWKKAFSSLVITNNVSNLKPRFWELHYVGPCRNTTVEFGLRSACRGALHAPAQPSSRPGPHMIISWL